MTFLRVIYAETLKLRRTIGLKMMVLAPAAVVVLTCFVTSQAPFSMLRRNGIRNEWIALNRLNLMIWAFLMMPLYITLETALISGLEHSENHWKSLLARPIPRWMFYISKLLIVMFLIAASSALLICGVFVSGTVLPWLQTDFRFGRPIPVGTIFKEGSEVACLGMVMIAIQHWVSMRWRSFSTAIAVGVIGIVLGYFAVVASYESGGWPRYFPWALPMLVLAQRPPRMRPVILLSSVAAVGIVIFACIEFCRRDVA